jgi:hypothetical protein
MKTVIVIAKYEAHVPEDMTASQISDLAEKQIRDNLEWFSVHVENYPDETEQSPMFDLSDVMCGTTAITAVGGD